MDKQATFLLVSSLHVCAESLKLAGKHDQATDCPTAQTVTGVPAVAPESRLHPDFPFSQSCVMVLYKQMPERTQQLFAGRKGMGSRLVRRGQHLPSSAEQVHAHSPSQALLQAPVKPLHTNGSSPVHHLVKPSASERPGRQPSRSLTNITP